MTLTRIPPSDRDDEPARSEARVYADANLFKNVGRAKLHSGNLAGESPPAWALKMEAAGVPMTLRETRFMHPYCPLHPYSEHKAGRWRWYCKQFFGTHETTWSTAHWRIDARDFMESPPSPHTLEARSGVGPGTMKWLSVEPEPAESPPSLPPSNVNEPGRAPVHSPAPAPFSKSSDERESGDSGVSEGSASLKGAVAANLIGGFPSLSSIEDRGGPRRPSNGGSPAAPFHSEVRDNDTLEGRNAQGEDSIARGIRESTEPLLREVAEADGYLSAPHHHHFETIRLNGKLVSMPCECGITWEDLFAQAGDYYRAGGLRA